MTTPHRLIVPNAQCPLELPKSHSAGASPTCNDPMKSRAYVIEAHSTFLPLDLVTSLLIGDALDHPKIAP